LVLRAPLHEDGARETLEAIAICVADCIYNFLENNDFYLLQLPQYAWRIGESALFVTSFRACRADRACSRRRSAARLACDDEGLEVFADRTTVNSSIFAFSGGGILFTVLLRSDFQTIRAALTTPVTSDRNECSPMRKSGLRYF
jgi:hypothetical protein